MLPMLYKLIREGYRSEVDANAGLIRDIAARAQGVMVDNVAEMLVDSGDFIPRSVKPLASLPSVAPPWPVAWYEWHTPRQATDATRMRYGALVFTEKGGDLVLEVKSGIARSKFVDEDATFRMGFAAFAEMLDKNVIALLHTGVITAGDHGEPRHLLVEKYPGKDEDMHRTAAAMMHVPMFAVSLMHCKNVVRKDMPEDRQPSEKWLRRTRSRRISYKVLDVWPMRGHSASGGSSTGERKSLHICRGHFRTYTDEAPLFGRVTGTFWVPQHLRGSHEQGVVNKDYRVHSTQE